MPTVEVNDTTLHYEARGSGPALLFIHGMCGDADVWADQAARLSPRHRCVRYDRRGHSRSGRGAAAISTSQHADDAAALIRRLDLAPCLVVGSSGGASIALGLALRHPELLSGLVCSEPPLFSLDRPAGDALLREIVPRLEQAMATGGPRAWVDEFFSSICPGLWSQLDEHRKDRYRANGETGAAELRSPALAVTAEGLAEMRVPALVLVGRRSHPTFRSIARRLADGLPDARIVEVDGSGHVTYAERPVAFAAAVAAFATELSARTVH